MIVSGYYGELVVTGDLGPRWKCWYISMVFFLYIVYELLIGLSVATNSETDAVIRGKIQTASVRVSAVKAQYRSAVLISGSFTFFAAYHYCRIFNAYACLWLLTCWWSPATLVLAGSAGTFLWCSSCTVSMSSWFAF